jgi:acetylornithine deacetylase/succinyl-diaminopimelate desuccinylase-like protein
VNGCKAALAYARAHKRGTLRMLESLIRIPSVSADLRHAEDVQRCAVRLARYLRGIGLDRVQVVPTAGHPLVYGEWCRLPGRQTVLVYGHYDVQPVDPIAEWRSPPFEPTYLGEYVYGRGASDNKGQICAHLGAVEAWLRGPHRLPVNVRFLLDGEEEIGSPHLVDFLSDQRRPLADIAVVSDTRMAGPRQPAVTIGLRGLLNLDLEVRGPGVDLHSGTFGGAVHNPLQVLSELLAGLHHKDGRVAVSGFYDRVRRWTTAERQLLAAAAPSDATVLDNACVAYGWGEPGWTAHERTTLRPAITINGLGGGHQGPGHKSVIPSMAWAKIGVRLVPEQSPRDTELLIRRHFAKATPPTVESALRVGSSVPPALFEADHRIMEAVSAAFARAFGARPVSLLSGGTIPAAGILRHVLGIPVVLLGLALPDDGAHAPNERFHLPTLWRGIKAIVCLLHALRLT